MEPPFLCGSRPGPGENGHAARAAGPGGGVSAVPSEVSPGEKPGQIPSGKRRLSLAATGYLIAIALVAGLVAAPFVPQLQTETYSMRVWVTFLLFATGAAVAQVALVKTGRNQSYHATNVFLIPAILLLPPELIVVVARSEERRVGNGGS